MSNNSETQLTACLLVYNHAHLMNKVISSILNQSFPNFRLLISDDCSTDNSYEIAKSFEKIDQRITVIKTPKNLGMAGNANFAIRYSKSDYIALLHHDDILDKQTFELWLNCINKNDKISFVFNDYKTEKPKNQKEIRISKNFNHNMVGNNFLKNILLMYWGCPVRGTALIRKKYFDEIGGMNERFEMLADIDLWMRLSAKWVVGYIDKPLLEVLQARPENYPNDYKEFSWNRIFLLFDIHSNNINKNNYSNYFQYLVKRFLFRNKVSFEIIKWYAYGLIRKKSFIIKEYSFNSNKYEFFYSRLIRSIIYKLAHNEDFNYNK